MFTSEVCLLLFCKLVMPLFWGTTFLVNGRLGISLWVQGCYEHFPTSSTCSCRFISFWKLGDTFFVIVFFLFSLAFMHRNKLLSVNFTTQRLSYWPVLQDIFFYEVKISLCYPKFGGFPTVPLKFQNSLISVNLSYLLILTINLLLQT